MLPITIRSPPKVDDFISLADYQSETPASFHDGKPVLHYRAAGIKAWLASDCVGKLPVFPVASRGGCPSEPESKALSESAASALVEQILDLYVTSETFTLYNPAAEIGVSIPYPLIAIHAASSTSTDALSIKTVWMQLQLNDGGAGDDEFDDLELTLVPAQITTAVDSATLKEQPEAARLYAAISVCSDLHPDPAAEGDDDDDAAYPEIIVEGSTEHQALDGFTGILKGAANGGLPPPMPGSSGWITAENVHEFFDEDGNWIGGGDQVEGDEGGEDVSGVLGEGAGRVRQRDEAEPENGDAEKPEGDGENKRPRMD
ncbi:hypothetical protein TD95_002593 [Thielaviopsis punctulata]|uniref:Protein LOT5 n=1 Tax=Thielaviopsis punctulata TaxID=72032 RepID=A0A0F4ZCW9_9PEZI|nr:hypothetical protein TD95_002593 [Thielaviopsis punctulata]